MPMVQQQAEGYATIRRSKGRSEQKLLRSSSDESNQQFEMIEMNSSRRSKSMNRKFDSDVLYAKRNVVFEESIELDEGVLNDIESDADALSACSDNLKRRTFETFKPRNSIESGDDGSDKDLQQSSECFQSLPYDIIMSPLKSPQYINQLNAMRSKAPSDSNAKQFPLYSRPDSPKYGKLVYNRSTSPSADSMDNSSSNSSTYSSNHHHQSQSNTVFKHTAMSQSLHIPHPHNSDENVILINVQSNGSNHKQLLQKTNLNYRKSFSHIQTCNSNGSHHRWRNENDNDSIEKINNPSLNSMTMTKSLYNPSTVSTTTHLCTPRRFATLAYPREKQQHETSNKSTSSLNERNYIQWDPILSCKIGSQSTLRTKPPVPWWELAIKREFRQSCPPMQVINFYRYC